MLPGRFRSGGFFGGSSPDYDKGYDINIIARYRLNTEDVELLTGNKIRKNKELEASKYKPKR